jgi:hypothetical protein
MPAILTCVVGKRLCEDPADDHWSLRDFAAGLVSRVCSAYAPPLAFSFVLLEVLTLRAGTAAATRTCSRASRAR